MIAATEAARHPNRATLGVHHDHGVRAIGLARSTIVLDRIAGAVLFHARTLSFDHTANTRPFSHARSWTDLQAAIALLPDERLAASTSCNTAK
jgi:hypothetical protein